MITFDNVRLDDTTGKFFLANGVSLRGAAGRVNVNASLPGADGVIPSLGSPYQAGKVDLAFNIIGASRADQEATVDDLLGLFSQRDRLIPLTDVDRKRQLLCQVTGGVTVDHVTDTYGKAKVTLEVPGVFWRDSATTDVTLTVGAGTLGTLDGGTAPINDALIRAKGPFATCTIASTVTGDQVTVNRATTASEWVLINTANWSLSVLGADVWTYGTALPPTAVVSNRGAGPMLSFGAKRDATGWHYSVTVAFTNGPGTVQVRARRAFM